MSEAGDPALIGRRLARKFVVEKFLGGGGTGAVYRARDTSLERNVALKVLHPAMAVDPSFVSRFHREAKAASRLDHPNSTRVIEFGEEPDGLLYIAMEYLEGRELYKVIHEDWPLPEPRIADIMMKVLAAAAVAHDMGVIHRDLKPENIMILDRKDDEGQDIVKVCDFGIAKITEQGDADPGGAPRTAGAKLTTAGLVVGTPEYMSPEQARGEKLDARSDLYSLGIILYQLLTGRTPFLAETAVGVVLKHITELPAPPRTIYPGVHEGLEAVAMRSLAKAREERFQSAREMRAAIKAAIDGRPVPASMPATLVASASSSDVRARADRVGGSTTRELAGSSVVDDPLAEDAINVAPLVGDATREGRRSRWPLFVGVAIVALAIGAASLAYTQRDRWMAPAMTPSVAPTSDSSRADEQPSPLPAPRNVYGAIGTIERLPSRPRRALDGPQSREQAPRRGARPRVALRADPLPRRVARAHLRRVGSRSSAR